MHIWGSTGKRRRHPLPSNLVLLNKVRLHGGCSRCILRLQPGQGRRRTYGVFAGDFCSGFTLGVRAFLAPPPFLSCVAWGTNLAPSATCLGVFRTTTPKGGGFRRGTEEPCVLVGTKSNKCCNTNFSTKGSKKKKQEQRKRHGSRSRLCSVRLPRA